MQKPLLPNYQITELLYTGQRTLVYRGVRNDDGKPVVIKFLRKEYPNFYEIVQFRHQYTITKNLNHPDIIKPLSLEHCGNSYALVMENSNEISLAQYIQVTPQEQLIEDFFTIAVKLTEVLYYLAQNKVIHKDIKPANILINSQTKEIKFIDFSISSLLPKESQEIQNPNVLEGTLAYIAPEQTGRMNRGIDYRSDFYSLGVTFYQLLTGKLPFEVENPLELVHSHIARPPIPPHKINPSIPPIISELILKLMAKNAEDRYQSALGLKYDLEQCFKQWQQTGQVRQFKLGERDLCDRFIIPEKLYGREQEVQSLLQAFDRVANGTSEMMLVTGFSGIGKTAVVNEVHKPITRQKGYFIKGKFDQFNRNIPLSAFVVAFRDLIIQLLAESDQQLRAWKKQILQAVGENGQILIEFIPELKLLIGEQPKVPNLSGSAGQNRFNLLFQNFIAVFTKKEHPLVLFLDDLQWADSASLQLLKLLMEEQQYLLFLGAYRDNEVSATHPFITKIEEIKKNQTTVNTITLSPLSFIQINQFVADTLRCTPSQAEALAQLIHRKTKGNPFFATQFLKNLHEEKHIYFNIEQGYWECDISQIQTLALTEDVVEFMAQQLQKLPEETQEILKLSACIGNQFDLQTLAIVAQKSPVEVASSLWKSLQEGLIIPQSEIYKFYLNSETTEKQTIDPQNNVYYRFLHDRVQQAAYSLIPEAQKITTHYSIGHLLLEKTPLEQQEERIFAIVNQLNFGVRLINNLAEKQQLGKLNLIACRKARSATAYGAGLEYAKIGLSCLGNQAWSQEYQSTLDFHQLGAELAFLCGDYQSMDEFMNAIIEQAQSPLDQVNVYLTKIQSWISMYELTKALETAESILTKLQQNIPLNPTAEEIGNLLQQLHQLLENQDIEALVNLPTMKQEESIATLQILNSISTSAYATGSSLFPFLCAFGVKLSIVQGNTSASTPIYALYSMIACEFLKDIDSGYKFGQLALKVATQIDAKADKPKALMIVGGFIHHRKSHLRETIPLLQEGYSTGLEVGSFEYADNSFEFFCHNSFWAAEPLADLEQEMIAHIHTAVKFNQLTSANSLRMYIWQPVAKLLDICETSVPIFVDKTLSEQPRTEEEYFAACLATNNFFGVVIYCINHLKSCYLMGEIPAAKNYAQKMRPYLMGAAGLFGIALFYFYDSLAILAQLESNSPERDSLLTQVEENQAQLQQFWVNYAPMNHQHKFDLVEAEKFRILEQNYHASDYYDRAIAGAKTNQYLQEEALANELAAKFYLRWDKQKIAAGYMQDAYYCYSRWGAKAKTDQLERQYPELLQPILLSSAQTGNLLDTLTTLSTTNTSLSTSKSQSASSTTSINTALDFTAVLQAAQTISSTLNLDELLPQLTNIILQNSGAERCALMVVDGQEQLSLRATATLNDTQLKCQTLAASSEIPIKLIQYVKNVKEVIVIDNLQTELPIIDDYLVKEKPASLVVLPIIKQDNLVGILYLENQKTARVFTKERLLVIKFLGNQIAISLENARLYQDVKDFAKQLEYALQDAQQKSERLEEALTLSDGQQRILQSIAQGLALNEALDLIAVYIEEQSRHPAFCSFLLLNKEHQLRFLSAPNLPDEYNALIDGMVIGSNAGSCGTAAYYKASVTVEDIANDPLWKDYQIALDYGLRACTSTPILDSQGEVLATLAMYQPQSGPFSLHDRKLMEVGTYLARIAIERHQADIKLQQLNLQIGQSEKMASLGNLVAGVAHEINNPVGFLNGSLGNLKDYIEDIFGHIKLYQQQYPDNKAVIAENAEDIELEFLGEDMPKMVESMVGAVERIKSISNSLRTFSRADSENKIKANLHEGLDSTLLILKYRLKANEKRPAIQIIKEYAPLREIDCFPGQLNQVFMNLIANAIDALDEVAQKKSYSELEASPQQIIITTSLDQNSVEITIRDNGGGIPPQLQSKIFEHLFTTKGVGKGTGLGLAIARQIVVEKHKGELDFSSEFGQGTQFFIRLPLSP